jgi:hypothetical protein
VRQTKLQSTSYSVVSLLKFEPSAHLLCVSFLLSILDIALTDPKYLLRSRTLRPAWYGPHRPQSNSASMLHLSPLVSFALFCSATAKMESVLCTISVHVATSTCHDALCFMQWLHSVGVWPKTEEADGEQGPAAAAPRPSIRPRISAISAVRHMCRLFCARAPVCECVCVCVCLLKFVSVFVFVCLCDVWVFLCV